MAAKKPAEAEIEEVQVEVSALIQAFQAQLSEASIKIATLTAQNQALKQKLQGDN